LSLDIRVVGNTNPIFCELSWVIRLPGLKFWSFSLWFW